MQIHEEVALQHRRDHSPVGRARDWFSENLGGPGGPAVRTEGYYAQMEAEKLPDSRLVKTVRVVFPSREMAMQEGVPLLDVGVTVVYLDRQMQDQILTAEDYTALA